MRRVAIALAILLALPAVAEASSRTLAPPGNSGVSQYVETVPTAGGGRPTSTVHPGGRSRRPPGRSGRDVQRRRCRRRQRDHAFNPARARGSGAGRGRRGGPRGGHRSAAAAVIGSLELHRTGFVGLGGLGEPGIVAGRERRQGPDWFDGRGRPRTPVAHRPDRQRPRRRGARARASPPRELITPAACVFVCLLSWSCCSVWAPPLGKLAPSVSRSGSAPTPP